MNVISAYAPQSERNLMEKEDFWECLRQVVASVSDEEALWIEGDLNGHVGKVADGYEGVHGGFVYTAIEILEGIQYLRLGDLL